MQRRMEILTSYNIYNFVHFLYMYNKMPPILFSTEEPQCDTSWNSIEGLNRFCKLLSIKVNQEVKPDNYYYKKLKKICMSRLK
jgi:hypothetical protein